MPHDVRLALVTAPSDEVALRLARALVAEELAACANLVSGITSVFRWENEVQEESETLLLIKTTATRFEALRARVVELHPYEVPEVIAIPVEGGHAPYLEWVVGSTGGV